MASELYLMEVGDGRYSILLCDDEMCIRDSCSTPYPDGRQHSCFHFVQRFSTSASLAQGHAPLHLSLIHISNHAGSDTSENALKP